MLIGFACGHVYHLTCLLRANPDTNDESAIERVEGQLGSREDEIPLGRPSVGSKVAHAHIIKNVIQGGCQSCIVPNGA